MGARGGIDIMVGHPKQAAAIGGSVLFGVVNIDVDNMTGQRIKQAAPARIARTHILDNGAKQGIELVVEMRDDWFGPGKVSVFVVGVEIAEIAPPEFVDNLTALEQARRAIDDLGPVLVELIGRRRL